MAELEKKPVKIVETILRDAHQSQIATRMTTVLVDEHTGTGPFLFYPFRRWSGFYFLGRPLRERSLLL